MIDSGCTDHLSPFMDDFIHLGDQKWTASVANGNKVSMYGSGTILIQQINGGFKPPTISLEEVWYAPDSSHHLLSVPSLTYHGYCCEITSSGSQIWDKRGHMVIQATALSPANNLHWFQSEIITPITGIVASLADNHSYHIWHQHFGHTSWTALYHASIHLSGVPLLTLPADLAPCKGCQIGKMPDHVFPASSKQASYPLALVHTSLIGPMSTEPHSCARYILTFIMIILDMLFCSSCGPSWTVCLIFTIWSLRLRPLLVILLPPCIQTEGVNLWDRSSRHSSLPKVSLIRLLFLTLLSRMDVLRDLIGTIGESNKLPPFNNDSWPQAPKPNQDVYVPIPIPCGITPDLDNANPALDQEPWFPPMSHQRPQTPLGFNSSAHPPSYRTNFSPLHPGIQCDQPETGHRSDIEDWHQYKRYMLTNSPPASLSSEEEDWLVKPIP